MRGVHKSYPSHESHQLVPRNGTYGTHGIYRTYGIGYSGKERNSPAGKPTGLLTKTDLRIHYSGRGLPFVSGANGKAIRPMMKMPLIQTPAYRIGSG